MMSVSALAELSPDEIISVIWINERCQGMLPRWFSSMTKIHLQPHPNAGQVDGRIHRERSGQEPPRTGVQQNRSRAEMQRHLASTARQTGGCRRS